MKKQIQPFAVAIFLLPSISHAFIGNSGGVEYSSPAPIGATLEPSCKGRETNFGVVLKPTCNGTNLRGFPESQTVNPAGGNLSLLIALSADPSNPVLKLDFPPEALFPKNYGTKCTLVQKYKSGQVICGEAVNGYMLPCRAVNHHANVDTIMNCDTKQVTSCVPGEVVSGLFQTYQCKDGTDDIGCSLLYGWNGQNQAAVHSYYLNGYSSCHFKSALASKSHLVQLSSRSGNGIFKPISGSKVLTTNHVEVTTTETDFAGLKNEEGGSRALTMSLSQDSRYLKQVADPTYNYSKDAPKCLEVIVSLMGNNQFCGSFYSPIMLFFDEKRPNFSGMSKFKLYEQPTGGLVYWPETNAPGYFLALDKNNDGKINDYTELFGKEDGVSNGFEKLNAFDSNHDNRINRDDKIFKKLLLWQDKNSDGQVNKGELSKLSSKVKAIGLNYHTPKGGKEAIFENRAEVLQESSFTFEGKNGETEVGAALDIWFYEVR